MAPTIEISDETYKKLAALAVGFDTPDAVILRLLNADIPTQKWKPELVFEPSEDEFRRELLKRRLAEITLYKSNGQREIIHWNASRFTESSNLRANLWSGYLRNWAEKQIIKAELVVLPSFDNVPGNEVRTNLALAEALSLKYAEIESIDGLYDYQANESDDGLLYSYIVTFDDDCPQDVLDKIPGLIDNQWVSVSSNVFDEQENEED